MTALKLFYQYDLMLLAYQANLAPFLIQELQESPYLIEAKFKIIDKFIDVLDQPTMLKLLDIINDIMEFKGDLQNNVVLNNTLPPMVRIQAFRLTQKILSHIPRVKNRVRTI